MKKLIHITGMTCQNCVGHVTRALTALPGVHATVDLATSTATVVFSNPISDEQLVDAVAEAGYTVTSIS